MRNLASLSLALGVSFALFQGAAPLRADLTLIDMFRNVTYLQTAGGVTPNGTFLNLEATMQNPGDFDSVSVSYPGPNSPDSLSLVFPTEFGEGPTFPDKASMDAAYPFGTYLFTANNSTTSTTEQASLDYTVDAFTSDIPALTTATFNALQGMDPNQPFTFDFNSFTPDPNADTGTTYLTVFNSAWSNGGQAPTATSATMPGGTLLPNTTYTYELDFSDRINGTDPINSVPTLIGFDLRTDGTFTTAGATPEPATIIPVGLALLGAAVLRLRRAAGRVR